METAVGETVGGSVEEAVGEIPVAVGETAGEATVGDMEGLMGTVMVGDKEGYIVVAVGDLERARVGALDMVNVGDLVRPTQLKDSDFTAGVVPAQ